MKLYQPNFQYTSAMIKLIEQISLHEGKIRAHKIFPEQLNSIQSEANIEAVHFSTKLEGNQLTLQQVTKALTGQKIKVKEKRDLKEILNYSKARAYLFKKVISGEELSLHLILEAHKILQQGIVIGGLKGHLRMAQNVISDARTKKIIYMPPKPEDVKDLLKGLLSWCKESVLLKLSPLIISPIFHYQFVTIHPFMDGNGRLGRLLSNFILAASGFEVAQYAALEKKHEEDRKAYYQELRRSQRFNYYDIPPDIDLSQWIEYWLTCLRATYTEALSRLEKSQQPQERLLPPRLLKAISLFKRHIVLKAVEYETLMGIGRTQAVADLNELISQKLIKKAGGGRSSRYRLCE